jgi:Uma2 family endonuclease
MHASAVQEFAASPEIQQTPAPVKQTRHRTVSWTVFDKRYRSREDGFKYEWVNGQVEKTLYAMNPMQLYIQRNLTVLFRELLNAGSVTGELLAETDLFFFSGVHRRPDFAWLTHAQINHLATEGVIEIPAFVIEVISTHDAASRLVEKMRHYGTAGVQVVWQIYPELQEVHVYSGPNLENMLVCTGEKICSAAPALPAFVCPTRAIFKKEEML